MENTKNKNPIFIAHLTELCSDPGQLQVRKLAGNFRKVSNKQKFMFCKLNGKVIVIIYVMGQPFHS